MIKINRRFDPLLRRPFSVYRTRSDQIEIVYQVVGRGTEVLSTKSSGENLQVLGPLGNGFTISPELFSKALLVAGGVGVASLMMLAYELRKRKIDVIALIGAANKEQLIGVDELAEISADVLVSTDDGSCGHHGLVSELLKKKLLAMNRRLDWHATASIHQMTRGTLYRANSEHTSSATKHVPTIYACGPYGMLKSVARTAIENDIPAQLSFESRMACGVGACLGCAIRIKTNNQNDHFAGFEYKRVCQDGPVFNAQEVDFSES